METAPGRGTEKLSGFEDEYVSGGAEAIHTDEHGGRRATGESNTRPRR
ncbi:MAG: hypothetical protein O2788_04815 [Chloroflexi bacterium]|nr:hypothetical protein [Chloroflexota bacterium]